MDETLVTLTCFGPRPKAIANVSHRFPFPTCYIVTYFEKTVTVSTKVVKGIQWRATAYYNAFTGLFWKYNLHITNHLRAFASLKRCDVQVPCLLIMLTRKWKDYLRSCGSLTRQNSDCRSRKPTLKSRNFNLNLKGGTEKTDDRNCNGFERFKSCPTYQNFVSFSCVCCTSSLGNFFVCVFYILCLLILR